MSDAEMAGAPGIATFAAMVRKELREGLRSFLASFAVVAIGLWFSLSLQRIMSASGAVVATATFTLSLFTITSALSALVIGGTQAVREARGDNFGFLTHRPVRRSTLFWGKAAAGILFYAVATGVPLAFATAWLATPGHRPMPYDPRMALPDIADLLSGIVYYFAAMLIGMREARWYKSGLLPVGAALACSTYVVATSSFPQPVVAIVVAAAAARQPRGAGRDRDGGPDDRCRNGHRHRRPRCHLRKAGEPRGPDHRLRNHGRRRGGAEGVHAEDVPSEDGSRRGQRSRRSPARALQRLARSRERDRRCDIHGGAATESQRPVLRRRAQFGVSRNRRSLHADHRAAHAIAIDAERAVVVLYALARPDCGVPESIGASCRLGRP